MGYSRAGFTEIVGVDNRPQKHYPFTFVLGDALEYVAEHGQEFDAIHASPPCQWITRAAMQWRKAGVVYPALLSATREALLGRLYVIEQPVGSVLWNPIKLNGAFFGMRVKRDRYFESNVLFSQPLLPPQEAGQKMGRPWDARNGQLFYPVGHFSGVAEARAVMGIDWYMTQGEIAQAIPPAYTEFIGKQLLYFLASSPERQEPPPTTASRHQPPPN